MGHDPDEALVILADAAEQLDLVLCDELEPIEIVAELVELAQRRLERPLVRDDQRRGDAVELARGVVLELAVGRDLALELDEVVGAAVHGVQGLQADRAQGDEQDDDGEERRQELRVNPHREPRDEPDQPGPHGPLASVRRRRTSESSSSGSNRTPRYCTRSTPSRSMSDVRKVWSTSPPALFRA